MVLGIFPDNVYEQADLQVGSGDHLIFYTDGITEARSAAGEEYGEDRLLEAATEMRHESSERLKDLLLARVNEHTGGKFDDDATLIVVGML
jgi:sigma-B regulation protein RsbU (phosphoserine phosphatase)